METLKTIQTFTKIGKILSKIAFILSLVSACICAVGLICLPFGVGEIIKIGGVTLHGLLEVSAEEGVKIAAIAMSCGIIVCAGEAVLAKFAERYFANELSAGTPFTHEGAGELRRLGILTIVLPTGCVIAAEILLGIMTSILNVAAEQVDLSFDSGSSITLGITFLLVSLLCRYGAQQKEGDAA